VFVISVINFNHNKRAIIQLLFQFDTRHGSLSLKVILFSSLFLYIQESVDVVDREDHKKFLDSVDFLSQHGMPALISDMEAATKEVLKG